MRASRVAAGLLCSLGVPPPTLILASSSPRRSELLANAGIPFKVCPADVPEIHTPGEQPAEFALRLARDKAQAVAKLHPGSYVLGADTIVIVDNEILGKPKDAADAERMLRLFSGRDHEVTTAVCVITRTGQEVCAVETTRVHFSPISAEEIRAYVANGEPMDRAGAYAIQGIASKWIDRVEGDYFTVMGLPVARVWKMLRAAGFAEQS
jgi:septum formation protein